MTTSADACGRYTRQFQQPWRSRSQSMPEIQLRSTKIGSGGQAPAELSLNAPVSRVLYRHDYEFRNAPARRNYDVQTIAFAASETALTGWFLSNGPRLLDESQSGSFAEGLANYHTESGPTPTPIRPNTMPFFMTCPLQDETRVIPLIV